jgi:hypothetical protein
MKYVDSIVMIGNEWSDDHRSPTSLGGKNTQTVHVQLAKGEDIDPHCERARKGGSEIIQERRHNFTAIALIALETAKATSGRLG